ncbi:MAG: PAS domain S-box protein [Flavobacterium sp.]
MITKILIIEHDTNDLGLIQQELKKGEVNFIVEIVHTEKEYEKALHNFKPDIILSNYTFPSFDGPAAFKIKEKLMPQTPFIFVSESIGEGNAIELIKNGVTDFVLKESLSTLTNKVNRALQQAQLAKSNALLKQSEEKNTQELFQNEAKFRAFFENSRDGLLLTVTDGEILAANPAACEIFQRTEEEIIDAGRFGLVDPTDPRLKVLLEERQRSGWVKGELTMIHKDGSKFPGELTSVIFKDVNGNKRTSMIIRDITDYKETEQKLAATSHELQQALNDKNKILDSSLDVICSFDEEGRFVHVNNASKCLWGYQPSELIGKKYMDLVFHEDAEITINADNLIKSGVPITTFENRFVHKTGKIVPLMWSSRWDDKEKLFFSIAKDATEKKNLEKAFEVERQRFMDLYYQAPSSMGILKGPSHVYEMANPLYLKLIGKKNIIGKTVKEALPEVEAQGVLEFLDKVYLTGETFYANEKLIQFDHDKQGRGKLVDTYLNFICQAHKNDKGEIDGIFFFAIDVTEQVLSRKKIEESEKRFRALIEKSEEMIMLTTVEGKLLYGSPSISKIFGYSEEDVAHKFTFDHIHPDDLTGFLKKRQEILTTPGKSFYHQQRVLHKNGNWIWCENTVTNMLHEPSINAFVTNFRDITEKKITEQQREFDRNNLNALINNTEELMWSVNKDYGLITSNKAFDDMAKATSGQIIPKGSNILTGLPPEQIILFEKLYVRAFTGETFTKIIYSKIPFEMWSEISYYPIRKGNEIIGTACHSRNITERKIAKLNLEQQNKELVKTNSELDRFVYSVSHDLRSPLTSILGLLSFIEEESQEPDTLEHAEMIHSSINRLDEFIKNILSYSRNNRTSLEVEKISLQETATAIVNSLHRMKEAKGIHFEIDINEQQSFYSDSLRFNTILENLVSNAIKYHKKDVKQAYVKITGQSDSEKLQITIADNGIGIAPEHYDKIFDMFFRLSGKTEGSGIGLYIVKNTVEKLQGTIEVQSELGTGTAFIITLKNLKS